MKKIYSKPELYTVEYSTNTAFCGQCADTAEKLKIRYEQLGWSNAFAIDDACSPVADNGMPIQADWKYCKFTFDFQKLMTS